MELSPVERAARDAAEARDAGLAGNSATRRARGIVHTPPALARSVARLADARLRALGVAGGLGDAVVDVIDPACGPGAFLAAATALAAQAGGGGARLHGLDVDADAIERAAEVLRAPADAAGLRLSLRQADTLRDPDVLGRFSGLRCPVVIGNPPWATAASRVPAPHMAALLSDLRFDVDGVPLGERKVGALSDTYVAFLRWSVEVATRAEGPSLVALVTNNSFLDGPVHRGLRALLCRSFSQVDVLDLGGNAMLARRGARDGNVFGVRTGVSVTLASRMVGGADGAARLRHARLHGDAASKLEALATLSDEALHWRALPLRGPALLMRPTSALPRAYRDWPSLSEAMPFHREGVQTNRDAVAVAPDAQALLSRLRAFAAGERGGVLAAASRPLSHYDPARARAAVGEVLVADPDGRLGRSVLPIAYRPFDTRCFAPVPPLCHRPRRALLAAMAASELALVTVRKDRGDVPWGHVGVVSTVPDSSYLSARSSCRTRAFPLRDPAGKDNVDPGVLSRVSERVGRVVGARELLLYALGALSDADYQRRFDEALHLDYPRLPWPEGAAAFDARVCIGEALRAAACGPVPPLALSTPGAGGAVALDVSTGELRIGTQTVARLPPGLVDLRVGHIRVCEALVRARRGAQPTPAQQQTLAAQLARAAAWHAALVGPRSAG